jgi:hypothetical protein
MSVVKDLLRMQHLANGRHHEYAAKYYRPLA